MKSLLFIILCVLGALVAGVRRLVGDVDRPDNQAGGILVPSLTPRQVEQFAYAGGTDTEIAEAFLITEDHLREQFGIELIIARAIRKLTIRRAQLDAAKGGSASLLMWLGRNELGQSTNPTTPGDPEPQLDEKVG